jgi:hypothetical protein
MRPESLTLAIAISAAALSGCATSPRVQGVEPAGPPPLRVWIGYPIGSSRVHPIFTNREAHVAMFEIIPGRGVTMVYPRSSADVFASDAHYADLTVQLGRMFYHTDPFGHASAQPRYYYAIASAAPLHLSRLLTSLGATRRVLGRMYASYRPYDVIDRLTELLVPMQADEDWATDLFVDWPMPAIPRSVVATRLIKCANGRVIEVAARYPYHGCPGDAALAVIAAAPKPPVKELAFDSVTRRRPQPGDRRVPIKYSVPDGEKPRRAEAGARPPRPSGMARSPSSEGIRYAGDRAPARGRGQSSGAPASPPASSGGDPGRSRTVERAVERAQPSPERAAPSNEGERQKKPDQSTP